MLIARHLIVPLLARAAFFLFELEGPRHLSYLLNRNLAPRLVQHLDYLQPHLNE